MKSTLNFILNLKVFVVFKNYIESEHPIEGSGSLNNMILHQEKSKGDQRFQILEIC